MLLHTHISRHEPCCLLPWHAPYHALHRRGITWHRTAYYRSQLSCPANASPPTFALTNIHAHQLLADTCFCMAPHLTPHLVPHLTPSACSGHVCLQAPTTSRLSESRCTPTAVSAESTSQVSLLFFTDSRARVRVIGSQTAGQGRCRAATSVPHQPARTHTPPAGVASVEVIVPSSPLH